MDDLISRQTVIEMVKDWNLNQHIMNEEDAIDDVNALPSAEPERKNGKWILKKELVPLPWDSDPLDWNNYDEKTHSEWKEYYHCSNCDWKSGEFKGGNFCSNCGSYNGGEQDEID